MLAADKNLLIMFLGGEYALHFLVKVLRDDFFAYFRAEGLFGGVISFVQHLLNKMVGDFSGNFQVRHAYGMGVCAFAVSLTWAQIYPFVAFQFYNGAHSETLKLFLVISFVIWAVLNLAFVCTIDLNYIHTFFSKETAAQYTVGLYKNASDDMMRFDAVFTNRKSFTKAIHGEIKEWVRLNIDRWRLEEQDWFKVALIHDEFLPIEVYEAEGGARRRRSSMSLREVIGLAAAPAEENNNTQLVTTDNTQMLNQINEEWKRVAEELYATRSSNHKSNFIHINRIFDENPDMLAGLTSRCPKFNVILSFLLEDRFGLSVKKVDWTKRIADWDEEDLQRVGSSVATFLRKRKTGDAAMDAWRLEYAQLGALFREVEGERASLDDDLSDESREFCFRRLHPLLS